ncbi:MAG: dihydrofolate reductase [Candidatus Pacebacteria bacterium]|nr:dihydrofolate reductase [Candidatus Paceibacterota bacterium]PIR60426.1 MAG: dihydrofolate reductase [Candidatus Pacebacteria bacterium CG10_big_fil_rev_8_21_14_0_10_44_54]
MHVFLIAALSADGFIAKTVDQISTRWTSKEDAAFFAQKTKEAGVVVMGRTTFETIGRPLPDRKTFVYTTRELLGFPPELVEATQLPPAELLAKLEAEGYTQVAICGGSQVYTKWMQSGLIDKIYLTIEPVFFGTGIRLFTEEITNTIRLKERHLLSDQTTVLEYEVLR